ncbi:unnamed protein product [Rhizophagus irregularis]|nr:unnamed protein product [Rhizophagus irregularis]
MNQPHSKSPYKKRIILLRCCTNCKRIANCEWQDRYNAIVINYLKAERHLTQAWQILSELSSKAKALKKIYRLVFNPHRSPILYILFVISSEDYNTYEGACFGKYYFI